MLSATLLVESCQDPKKNKNKHVKDDYCSPGFSIRFEVGSCPCAASVREQYKKLKMSLIGHFMNFSQRFVTEYLVLGTKYFSCPSQMAIKLICGDIGTGVTDLEQPLLWYIITFYFPPTLHTKSIK